VELNESSRIPVESAQVRTEWWHYGSGRVRRVHKTCGISDGGLRGASECETSGDQLAGLRETSGIPTVQAGNQWICEGRARKDGPVISGCTPGVHVRGRAGQQGVRAVRASTEEFKDSRVRQARLTRKLPSPALKEAECSGSYNPSILNTLTRGTVRHCYVQGQTVEQGVPGGEERCIRDIK
jgi:hypothetical protein